MKPTLFFHRTLCMLALSCLCSLAVHAQTFFDVASNPTDNNSQTNTTVAVTPPGSMQAGDLVVIYAHYRYNDNNLTISQAGGQTWTPETQYNNDNQRIRIFWCRFNGTWSANPSVTGGGGSRPLSVIMYVFRPSNSNSSWGKDGGPTNNTVSNGTTAVTVTGRTTTNPNTVTMAFWATQSANTWGTLTGTGWSKTGLSAQYRNTGGSDQSHTAAYNIQASAGATGDVTQTRSAGNLATRRSIISWYEIPPPPNDECADAIPITSGQTCSNTAGTLISASYTPVTGACGDDGGNKNDVWYSFVAQSANPTITLSSAPTQRSIQLFSGTCGSLSSLDCATNSNTLTASGLTIGNTYYVRIFSDNNTAGTFNICIVDPPSNDDCSGAITLPVGGSCSNISGTVIGATASTPTTLNAACGGGNAGYDVWYRFTAVTTGTTNIALSSIGANFTNRRMEAYTGNCGSLSYVTCTTGNTLAVSTTAGTTYYVRVASTSAPAPTANGNFNICATTTNPPLRFGNSYVNVSKRSTGGQVQPGDTLEIRMTINHTSGTVYFPRYVDNIPINTAMLTGEPIKIITNEGLTYKSYTANDGVNDDPATYKSAPGVNEYNIKMNLGFGATNPGIPPNNTAASTSGSGTMIANTHNPKGGGGMIFATAFRVVVTGSYGDTINLYPGQFLYRTSAGGSDITLTATPYQIVISEPLDLCANSIGVNIASEYGGTFGNGTSQSRITDLAIPIATYTYVNNVNPSDINSIGDGKYSIVKNISPKSGTDRNARKRPDCDDPSPIPATDPLSCTNRMFGGHWDVDGDHTGTNNAIGNDPPSLDQDGGYMLLVNADYVASEVYRQTISTLCPNTYYEFSAWVRNVCSNCGMDSLGRQMNAAMPPALQNGYPGVNPNLTFALNGMDIYSSGEIEYGNGWVKKGFVFRTDTIAQDYTLSIRNNSQGGGGNDWALDDIAVATCFPSMFYSPSQDPVVCEGNVLQIADTVRSYFDNYTLFKWQRSTDGGVTWDDIPGTAGSVTPVIVNGQNEFICTYTIPPEHTQAANAGDLYRVVVASMPFNLDDPSCAYSDPTTINLSILTDCGPVLKTELLSVSGRLANNKAVLTWVSSKEEQPVEYIIERSDNGANFTRIATVAGYNNPAIDLNNYSYTDPAIVTGKVYYRIVMASGQNALKYSNIIQLNTKNDFALGTVVNPFGHALQYEILSPVNGIANISLIDAFGKVVRMENRQVYTGTNTLTLNHTAALPAGIYILKATINGQAALRKVMKQPTK